MANVSLYNVIHGLLNPKSLRKRYSYMDVRELDHISRDLKVFIDTMSQNAYFDPNSFIVAGGFARRMYMIQNGMHLKDTDTNGDIDIFVAFKDVMDGEYDEMKVGEDNSDISDSEEFRSIVSSSLESFMLAPHNGILNCVEIGETKFSPNKKTQYLSRAFNALKAFMLEKRIDNKNFFHDMITKHKSFSVNYSSPSFCVPLSDTIQLIANNESSIEKIVEKFDMDNSKFISRYPFDTSEYIGKDANVLTSPYVINDLFIRPNGNYVKSFARIRKYCRYGFVLTEEAKQKLVEFAKLDTNTFNSHICYYGETYT